MQMYTLQNILKLDLCCCYWIWIYPANNMYVCVYVNWKMSELQHIFFWKNMQILTWNIYIFWNTYSRIYLPIQWTYPQPTPKRQGDTSNRHISPQLLAEYVQYQCISSSDRFSSVFAVYPIQTYLWYRGPICRGSIFHTNIFQWPNLQGPKQWHTRPQRVRGPIYHQICKGPNLPKNGTLGPKKCGAQFTTKLARGPICRGPICKKWHTKPQKVRGPIYHQIGEGPNLPESNLPRTT